MVCDKAMRAVELPRQLEFSSAGRQIRNVRTSTVDSHVAEEDRRGEGGGRNCVADRRGAECCK